MREINLPERIIWMVDESIANSAPSEWDKVMALEKRLVELVGKEGINHDVIDPRDCLRKLVPQLENETFSVIFDLTGWLTPAFKELFPDTPIVNTFSMSRIRVVSSPSLDSTGYTISMSPDKIAEASKNLDLSKPLVIDDVSFTGSTSHKTIELWSLDPKDTSHAFLIGNTGFLDQDNDIPGAVIGLQRKGSRVFVGHELRTPFEDGWHLKDLHMHDRLDEALGISTVLHKAFEEDENSKFALELLERSQATEILFPKRFSSSEILQQVAEGKFALRDERLVRNGVIHASNPFLWASKYFQEHVDVDKIIENRDEILEVLTDLRALTSDPSAKIEAGRELAQEVQNLLSSRTPESRAVIKEK